MLLATAYIIPPVHRMSPRRSPILSSARARCSRRTIPSSTPSTSFSRRSCPALPVVDESGRLRGIFGEREFFAALFPGYLGDLSYAAFVPRSLESALQKRATCRGEPVRAYMNTEHVDVDTDFSDAQVAETFLHHRVLILPVLENKQVVGVITRADFFRALAERFLSTS
jgi:CBS domain-containing protein